MRETKETFESYLQERISDSTLKFYLLNYEKFILRMANPTTANYKDVLAYIHTYKVDHNALAVIKHYYNFLIDTAQREDHPCRRLYLKVKRSQVQHQELFTGAELELLMDRENRYRYIKLRNKVIISLLIYQGLSPENVIRLKVDDLDFDDGTVYIKATKLLHRRTLELKAKQIHLIYRYVHECKEYLNGKYLFYSMRGDLLTIDVIQNIVEMMQPLFVDRELTLTKIRQSVISNWINEEKIPLEDVQLLAGHKWLSTTEKYKKEDREQKRELINRFFPL